MGKHFLSAARRIVIKIGSSLLVDEATGKLQQTWLSSFLADVAACSQRGQQIVIVSSGAIALGRNYLNFNHALQLEEKQAAASVGQIQLANAYQIGLDAHGLTVAQILLTLEDSENRRRYLNAKNTLETLLSLKVIPLINENDTIATAEIRYGDNDRLAARVAQMIQADTLVLLSDIEGLYNQDPRLYPHANLITEVTKLDATIFKMAGGSLTSYGSGGMVTKLAAAKIAMASGTKMIIAAGKYLHPLKRIDETDKKTWFIPQLSPTKAKKNWLAQHLKPKGKLFIDEGACQALLSGKSLLAIGIMQIEGDFYKGDPVSLFTKQHAEIARGLINYHAHEAKRIIGKQSHEYETILGYKGNAAIIHRDDLVITQETE